MERQLAKREKAPKADAKSIALAILKCLLLAFWVMIAVVGTQLLVGYPMIWILGQDLFLQPVWTSVYSALSYSLAFVILLFLTPKLQNLWGRFKKSKVKHRIASRAELGLKGLPTWTDIGLAPVGYIVASLAAVGLSALFSNFAWYSADQEQELSFATSLTGFDRVLAFFTLALVAPIAEELIFRGWLYGKIREILGARLAKWLAITLSILIVSVLFGVMHGQWNVGITVFVMSVVMCGLREMTGTIYAGIFVHIIRNALAFYLMYVLGL